MTLVTRCLHPGLSELVPGFRFLVEISSSVELLVFTLLDFHFFKETTFAEETALRKDERQIKYGLELRKKDAQINAIKSFNDFSKKIQPTNKNKPTDKLSDAEKKIIKSLSK